MKAICLPTLFVFVSALVSCGNGVATLDPGAGSRAGVPMVNDGNNSTILPATNINEPRVNPAHGKPGHRCDIAVGAPLTFPAVTPVSTPAATNSATQPLTVLNPPHGQPGHRCDIAVGKPLTAASPQPPANLPSALPILTPPPIAPTATSNVAPGMNPPHGQPGHRCDIPVGKPLSSKPAN